MSGQHDMAYWQETCVAQTEELLQKDEQIDAALTQGNRDHLSALRSAVREARAAAFDEALALMSTAIDHCITLAARERARQKGGEE